MGLLISICIPSYKRVYYLQRLLDSIVIQTYKNYEVIISDDSNDDSVKDLLEQYKSKFKFSYCKNFAPLGTPANWNFAISKAKGEWIKLMHDDDWFISANSLQVFADYTKQGKNFIFSAHNYVYENNSGEVKPIYMPATWKKAVIREPGILFAQNVIGPPSATLVHSSIKEVYDERLKWRVDIEYYMRLLQQEKDYCYIDQPLINFLISESQVTQSCLNQPEIELPEGLLLIEKHGINQLKNVWIYDAWWRLLRNMDIKSEGLLMKYVNKKWPAVIVGIANDLSKLPNFFLDRGFFSKTCMFISYCKNFKKIK